MFFSKQHSLVCTDPNRSNGKSVTPPIRSDQPLLDGGTSIDATNKVRGLTTCMLSCIVLSALIGCVTFSLHHGEGGRGRVGGRYSYSTSLPRLYIFTQHAIITKTDKYLYMKYFSQSCIITLISFQNL